MNSDPPGSAWAPLREPTFRMLWLVWATANVCLWMNDVAAAWLMTSLTTSPVLIALVTTASALPVFLLGIPSGALADILDRRRYFIGTQIWVAVNAAVLVVVSALDMLSAHVLLLLTFTNGIGLALRWPVFAAIVPELVPRSQLPAALALNAVAMNGSRVIGPLVAGSLISAAGSHFVFALNCVLSVACAFAIMRWKRERKPSVLPGERFIGAMRLGWQYVRESRGMRASMVRVAAFFGHSTALVALLPLVAKGLHDGGPGTFTLLLSTMGMGAIASAGWLPRLRHRWDRDRLASVGTILHAVAAFVVALSPNAWVAAPAMFVCGIGWILTANSVAIAAQLALPDWVRARGMSMFQMAIMGASALGAVIWGKLAEWVGVPASLLVASVSMLVVLAFTRSYRLDGASDDLSPARLGDEPVPSRPIDAHEGPVMITVEYLVDPARTADFEAIMSESRSARLRQGAVSWGLFEDVHQPGRFVEYFACSTWADYLRRFDRFTASDERLHERRHALHIGPQEARIGRFVARHPAIK